MPKKPSPGASGKKARWTPADKKARAAAAARSPKKARRAEADRYDRSDRSDRSDRPERRERADRPERGGRYEYSHGSSRPARSGTGHVGGREWRAPRDEHRRDRDDRGDYRSHDRRDAGRGDRDRRPYADRDVDRRNDRRDRDRDRRDFGRRDDDRGDRDRRDYDGGDRDRRDYDRGDRDRRGYDRRDERPRYERQGDRSVDRREREGRGDDRRSYGARDRGFERRDDRGSDRRGGRRFDDRRSSDRPDARPRFDRGDDRWSDRRDDRRHDRGGRFERRDRFDSAEAYQIAEAERREADTWTKATRTPVSDGPVEVAADNGFATLGLPERLVERLARDGITDPFPIQAATIPDALAGRDVLGRGQTGSGKTLAFGLPMITRLLEADLPREPRRPHALVLVPTRELAMQVSDALEPLVHVVGLRHKLVAGGLSYTTQINALAKGIDILVATPGRLNDLLERGAVEMDAVRITVLDEADHMAEMGFLAEITTILDRIPSEGGQRLLFSATLDNGIDTLVHRYLEDPAVHSTDEATASVETMEHHVLLIAPMDKKAITAEVANRPGRTVVFCRTKLGADRVAAQLREQGVLAAALHGGLGQGARNRVLGAFRDGTLPVLVATDVAARGIHVDDVSVVLQVDPPADHKDYLHRSGRTARAGDKGTVVTLALPHQRRTMERQLRDAGLDIAPVTAFPGDAIIAATGATVPSGEAIAEEDFQRLLSGPKDHRRGPAGARGPRHGSRGGFRPHHGGGSRHGDTGRQGSRGRRDEGLVSRWGDDERGGRRGARF